MQTGAVARKGMVPSIGLALIVFLMGWPVATVAQETDKYTDEWFGFTLEVPKGWERDSLAKWNVRGVIRCAWSGPARSALGVYVREPEGVVTARQLLDDEVKRGKRNHGVEVLVQDVRTIAGMRAMWLAVKGKGDGSVLDGEGTVETTQHWVGIPREKDIIIVVLTCPSKDYEGHKKSFEKTLASLVVKGSQTKKQREVK